MKIYIGVLIVAGATVLSILLLLHYYYFLLSLSGYSYSIEDSAGGKGYVKSYDFDGNHLLYIEDDKTREKYILIVNYQHSKVVRKGFRGARLGPVLLFRKGLSGFDIKNKVKAYELHDYTFDENRIEIKYYYTKEKFFLITGNEL